MIYSHLPLKPFLCFVLLGCLPLSAQVPRAQLVDSALEADAANDFFQRSLNVYAEAQKAGDQDLRQQLYLRSVELFGRYLDEFPRHQNAEAAWWYLGNSHYQAGQVEDARRCFATLLNRYGKGKWAAAAAYTLAADHYNKGEYAFAAPMFERYASNAEKPEERPRGYYYAGNCYRLLGRDAQAIGAYRKVIDDPAGGLFAGRATLALGHLAARSGKEESALKYFESVIEGNHTSKAKAEASLHAALNATKLGRSKEAEAHLRRILTTEGMEEFRPDAQTALMANHFANKEYDKVIELFRRSSIEAEGEKEAARRMLVARALLRKSRPEEALAQFREVERLVPPETETAFQASYYRLLCFYEIEGRHVPEQVDAFVQLYQTSRPNDPRIHTALMMKAQSLFETKDYAAAAKAFSEIDPSIVSEKNRAGLLYQSGWTYMEAGDLQNAIRSLSDFISQFPKDSRVPSALAKRAKAYAEAGEQAKAIADFDRLTQGDDDQFAAFAWLESARMRRAEGNIEDTLRRYRGLLKEVSSLSQNLKAEANYWIGWGLVKSNQAAESTLYLEKARELRPDAYRKHAGLLLALGYYAAQNPNKLSEEIHTAIEGEYVEDIPDQAIQWAGMQAYNAQDYPSAAQFLGLVANDNEPRETPKEVWRYLAKASLRTGDAKRTVSAVSNVLAVEDQPAWKADGLLDRGRALLSLDRPSEARIAADEALALHPQGRTSARLRILIGDLDLKEGDAAKAAAAYHIAEINQDDEIRPLALSRLAAAYQAQGNAAEAEKYRARLTKEFPDWEEPKVP